MSRLPRLVFDGAIYHVTVRGNNGEAIFIDDRDRFGYLALLARTVGLMSLRLFAYTLMTTHVHLVLQTMAPNISAAMHRLHSSYAHNFNRRHGRRGHLFESRFWSRTIDDDADLLATTRYAHVNPVQAGLVRYPEDYRWSSYRCYFAREVPAEISLVDVRPVLQLFSLDPSVGRQAYERFVREAMETTVALQSGDRSV